MGACLSKNNELPENVFKVRNIDESGSQVGIGYLEVTDNSIVFRSHAKNGVNQYEWPLRYLRKYGCDGDIFSFEAGHRCQGGEGIYAFSTKHASRVFDLIQVNLNARPSASELPPRDHEGDKTQSEPSRTSTSHSPTKDPSPHQQNGTRSQSLPVVGDSRGSLLSCSSEQSSQPLTQSTSSLRPEPPSTIKEEEEKETTEDVKKDKEARFPYAKVNLPSPTEDKPLPKVPKTNYTKIVVDGNLPEPIRTPKPDGVIGGEYVNYNPGQGIAEQSPTATTPGSPSGLVMFQPGVNYSNLNYSNGEVVLPQETTKLNYAMLDFQDKRKDGVSGGESGVEEQPKKPVIKGSTTEVINYALLDYNAMDSVKKLNDHVKERISRN